MAVRAHELCAVRFCNSVIRKQPPHWFQIGITITESPDGPIVTSVNPQGPAGLSGQVIAGDVIIKWNGLHRRHYTKQQMMDVSCANWMGADVHLELQRIGEPQLIRVSLTPVSPADLFSWHEHVLRVSKTEPLDASVVVAPGCHYAKDRETLHTFGELVRDLFSPNASLHRSCFYDRAVKAYFLKRKFGRHGWKGLDDMFPEGRRRKDYQEVASEETESFLQAMDVNPGIWSFYFQEDDL